MQISFPPSSSPLLEDRCDNGKDSEPAKKTQSRGKRADEHQNGHRRPWTLANPEESSVRLPASWETTISNGGDRVDGRGEREWAAGTLTH
ncbi:hypothetical protein EVAR_53551_1 [Eumeta japonica]|uniref:Uncharacterized protein n=1 Tax=Eumeta variegata TaxID=151549 RepID=A0A4C1YPB7_EUMVA|nr:hypothetical protein EVAR_53551_1 [Eumeta japonica]